MKLLIDKGAGVNAMTKQGFSVLQFAANGGHLKPPGCSSRRAPTCVTGTKRGQRRCTRPPSSAGARRHCRRRQRGDRQAADRQGGGRERGSGHGRGHPAPYAAQKGNRELVELLIASGADSNAKSGFFGTPLNVALRAPVHGRRTIQGCRGSAGRPRRAQRRAGNAPRHSRVSGERLRGTAGRSATSRAATIRCRGPVRFSG